jgi:hypothetical protein
MMLIDSEKVAELEKKFKPFGKKGVDIIDFIRIFLISIEHKEEEALYLLIALIDLFKEITETNNMSQTVSYNEFTSFVCDVYFSYMKIHF